MPVLTDIDADFDLSALMKKTRKSISGIRFPTEIDFRTCQLCHRENCPSRSASFDPELWESIQGD